jgi:hypothetical protein
MVVISELFFGFSIEIINLASYIYLANTYITRERSIEHFRIALGVLVALGTYLAYLPYLIPSTLVSVCVGVGLIVLSYVLSKFLPVKRGMNFNKKSNASNGSNESIDSLDFESKRSVLLRESHVQNYDTYVEHNEKFDIYEVKGLWKFFKELPYPKTIGLIGFGLWLGSYDLLFRLVGVSGDYKDFMSVWYIPIQALGLFIGGVILATVSWDKYKLEKGIILGVAINIILLTVVGLGLEKVVGYIFLGITIGVGSITYGLVMLAIPYYLEFNIDCFGKGYGFVRWWACFEQFVCCNFVPKKFDFGSFAFDAGVISPVLISFGLIMISFVASRRRNAV